MVKIEKKCGNCGKFEVPAEYHHLVKPEHAGRVCRCATVTPAAPAVERVVVRETFWVKAIAIGLLLTGLGWFISNEIAKHEAEEAEIRQQAFRLMDLGLSKENAMRVSRGARRFDKNF